MVNVHMADTSQYKYRVSGLCILKNLYVYVYVCVCLSVRVWN